MSDRIPSSVAYDDVVKALEPFFALLRITPGKVYAHPPIVIAEDEISFAVPALQDARGWAEDRPPSIRAGFNPQAGFDPERKSGNYWPDSAVFVRVPVSRES